MSDKDFKFEVTKQVGIISERTGWKKELNIVSWNGREPKYDIREWDEKHEKMGKGITLNKDELVKLREIIDAEIKHIDDNG
jgi:hypothetical protein